MNDRLVELRRIAPALLILGTLTACDAWPMEFQNNSTDAVSFRYLHKDYPDWSAWLPFDAGKGSLLNRAHYFKDIRGLRIRGGKQAFEVSPAAMLRFHDTCDDASVCKIFYDGRGRFHVVAD